MKNYIRGTIVGLGLLIGGLGGFYYREYFPPVTKFIFDYDKNETAVKAGSVVAGAGLGTIIAMALTELLKRQNRF